jgi:putative PIN family toxin of toxin-antitoxin system
MGAQGSGTPPRVVLDTNVVVSALVFRAGALAWLREAWRAGALVPLVSRATVDELLRVLSYPKFRLSQSHIEELLALYLPFAQVVLEAASQTAVPECRDADDQKFLDLAYLSEADHLITGDRALLDMAAVVTVPIITPAEFMARFAPGPGGAPHLAEASEPYRVKARPAPKRSTRSPSTLKPTARGPKRTTRRR